MKWVRDQGLTLFFTALFLASLVGQALVGHSAFNHEQLAHGDAPLSLGRYVTSSAYWVDVTENWQSEYLQFSLMILATIWLMQRGSTESKPADRLGTESDEDQKLGEHARPDSPKWASAGGMRTFVYSWSLLIVMGDDLGRLVVRAGASPAASVQRRAGRPPPRPGVARPVRRQLGLLEPHAAELAVGVPRRRVDGDLLASTCAPRGSAESKPVGAPHTTRRARRARRPRRRPARATSARTSGATSVPNSSIERITWRVRHRAEAQLGEEALVAEQLVLEEDLLRHLLRVADEQRAARRASTPRTAARVSGGQPRSRPIRLITPAYGPKYSSRACCGVSAT